MAEAEKAEDFRGGVNKAGIPDKAEHKVIVVDPDLKPMWEEFHAQGTQTMPKMFKMLGAKRVEAMFDRNMKVVYPLPQNGNLEHGFMTAVRCAYSFHIPLAISPDMIWNLIIQSIAKHIEQNAEKLRHLFVDHEGQKQLSVRRDDFGHGDETNPWPEVFEVMSEMIAASIGKETYSKLCPTFSTTTSLTKACNELALMNALKKYFKYKVYTLCGMSSVKLYGITEDWQKIQDGISILKDMGLEWWYDELEWILKNFTRASKGEKTDECFWECIYKAHKGHGSGAHPTVDGWATNFFLYINKEIRSQKTFRSMEKLRDQYNGVKPKGYVHQPPGAPKNAIPVGLTKTPFIWQFGDGDDAQLIPKNFYGGFCGATLDEKDNHIYPVLGWAVGSRG